jgi:hypothetical protein
VEPLTPVAHFSHRDSKQDVFIWRLGWLIPESCCVSRRHPSRAGLSCSMAWRQPAHADPPLLGLRGLPGLPFSTQHETVVPARSPVTPARIMYLVVTVGRYAMDGTFRSAIRPAAVESVEARGSQTWPCGGVTISALFHRSANRRQDPAIFP